MNPRKKFDLYPLDFFLLANGAAITDLAGSTVAITLRNKLTASVKVTLASVTILDTATASCRWTPIAGHVDTPGLYLVEVRQTRPDTTLRHFPSDGYEELEIEDVLA